MREITNEQIANAERLLVAERKVLAALKRLRDPKARMRVLRAVAELHDLTITDDGLVRRG